MLLLLFAGRGASGATQVSVLGTARGLEKVVPNLRHAARVPGTPTTISAADARVAPPPREHPASPG